MPLAFPIQPVVDESLPGFVVRATAANFLRSPLGALSSIGIKTVRLGSLTCRPPLLATSIAQWTGTKDVEAIARMFHPPLEGRAGWIDFYGEPLRAMYRQPDRRRVAPGALKKGDYLRATWSLRPLSFDPATKEALIDTCPQCKRLLGWTRTYGVSYCDHCTRPVEFDRFVWDYPDLDLRDFPQPKIEVDDEEALDFLTDLIDPSPERKNRSRRLVPEMWSTLSAGDLFEVGVTFACMLGLSHWDKQQTVSRRTKSGGNWNWLTPRMLSIGGRALLDGQRGFETFGDILRCEGEGKSRNNAYGKWAELGPLSIVEPSLCEEAKTILGRATESYIASRRNPDMQPLQYLADKHGITRKSLSHLAESGVVATNKFERAKRGPVMMSEAALTPLLREKENTISANRAAAVIGVHPAHMDALQRLGLLEKVEGAVLKLLTAEAYYTRRSVDKLKQDIERRIGRSPKSCLRLRVAVRACTVQAVPWAGIVQSILNGALEVFRIKADRSRKSLGDRLAVRDSNALASLMQRLASAESNSKSEWIGNAAASEILGVNEVAVWRLARAGGLKKHDEAPLYSHFKRSEVERLSVEVIFAPEIARAGRFRTFREASAWLKQHRVAPKLELKKGGWKVYPRAEVEKALKLRADELTKMSARISHPKGQRHGPESPSGRLAATRESADPSRVGYATAAGILGSTIFAVQKLVAIRYLKADNDEKFVPFLRCDVHALAKRIVFIPEIKRLSGYKSNVAVMNWLENAAIEPIMRLKIDAVPVFDRAVVEEHIARPEFARGAHPRWIKRKLLDMVARGNSVHQASIACLVSYPTAKRWAATDTAPNAVRAPRGEYPPWTKHKLLGLVERGSSIRQASVACAVNYSTARRWGRTALAP